jgi:hypothetical protein
VGERALLIRARKHLLIDRLAADHNRASTDKELLFVETEVNEGFITDFDLQLLSLEKLYPILFESLYEGEEPLRLGFGEKESQMRTLDRISSRFPGAWPTPDQVAHLSMESEFERLESELCFLNLLSDNNEAMKNNTAIAEKIRLITWRISNIAQILNS